MGLLRFVTEHRRLLTEERLKRSYVSGMDEAPFYGRTLLTDDQLVIEREEDHSGCFAIPWPVPGHGDWLLATATLPERELPYLLEVELARGLVFRVRDQLAVWQMLGLEASEDLLAGVRQATIAFSRAATRQRANPAEGSRQAQEAILIAADAACVLAELYADQALALRRQGDDKLSTLLGAQVGTEPPKKPKADRLTQAFNLAIVPCGWADIEPNEGRRKWSRAENPLGWARGAGMRVCAGPLLEFDEHRLPDWAYLWEGDLDTLNSLMVGHVRAVVERLKGKVQLWNVASRVNRDRVLSLSDDQRLQIVANAIRTVRKLDPQTPVIVGFDQPWGEYRGSRPTELSPLDYADAIERADLGVAGFNLELNIGYGPQATELRNPLAFSRLIDMWNVRLESPLMLSITFPSASTPDSLANAHNRVTAHGEEADLLSPEFQAEWARRRLPMLLAKNAVQVIAWNQLTDAAPHPWPHGGLFDGDDQEKPIVGELQSLRESLLM